MLSSQPLKTDSMLCLMDDYNNALSDRFNRFLAQVVRNKAQHTRFLNSIALLEHLGCRKIVMSQPTNTLSEDVLKHLAEEARHAYFFKKMAHRVSGEEVADFSETNSLKPVAAYYYLGRLEAALHRLWRENHAAQVTYLGVSWTIELRAVWAYKRYQACLDEAQLDTSVSVKGILAEEDRHLDEMVDGLYALGVNLEKILPNVLEIERRCFERLFNEMERASNISMH